MEVKKKKCSECGAEFRPYGIQPTCSAQCARKRQEKRKKTKEERQRENGEVNKKNLMELAVITFNSYIRLRDQKETCICCGKPLGKNYHAGHYFSGGAHSAVKFDEDNVHAQRAECNTGHRAGMIADYGERLELKIGKARFELLRNQAYEPKRWTVQELNGIIREYKAKINQINKKEE